jgi:hypothetical protein
MEINFARRVKAQMTRSNFSPKTSPGGIITTTVWPHPFGSSLAWLLEIFIASDIIITPFGSDFM